MALHPAHPPAPRQAMATRPPRVAQVGGETGAGTPSGRAATRRRRGSGGVLPFRFLGFLFLRDGVEAPGMERLAPHQADGGETEAAPRAVTADRSLRVAAAG